MLSEVFQLFLLAQTAQEKRITYFGLIFFGLFVGVLLLDSFSKGKLISTKGPLKKIILWVFIVVFAVLFFVSKFYK